MPEDSPTPVAGGTPDAGAGNGASSGGGTPPDSQNQTPLTFESWLTSQDDAIKKLIDGHIKGLKATLETERTQRKDFERQVKDLASKLEKGSDGWEQAEALASQIAQLERQAAFYDAAHAAGVTNLRLAWLAAQDAKLINDKNQVDLDALKAAHPQLFAVTVPSSNATNPGGQRSAKLTLEDVKRMRPEEINRRWAEVSAVLSQ